MTKRIVFRSHLLAFALLLPQLVIISVFFFWPAGQALLQAVQQQDAFGTTSQFVGLDNFKAIFSDPAYRDAIGTTVVFSCFVAAIGLGLALILAAFADRVIRGATFYRTILVLPYAVAPAVAGLLWAFLFSTSIGFIPFALKRIGLEWNHLLNGTQAMVLVVIASVWKQLAYNFLFFVAGLQAIPKSLIEAAALDGAGPVRRFIAIQFPLLSPTVFFLLVMNFVYAFFETFAVIDITTQGGPGKSTETLVYRVYFDGFRGLDLGSSAAQSVVLMAIVIVLTVFQFRYIDRKVNY
jgi:sn-glycerol 3-phosphate transport system permease protein